jgi:malonyl-CoA O-methyltransferase
MAEGVGRSFDRACRTYREAARAQALAARDCARLSGEGDLGRVLEIGAGCGLLSELLAPRASRGYLALDLSRAMLSCLQVPGVLRLAADAEAPPLRPGTFDFLASASALQWFVRPGASLPACLDLLRPGGGFCLAVFTAGTLAELAEASRVSGFGSFWPLRPAREYRDILAAAPGVRLEWEEREYTLRYPTARGALEGLRQSGAGFGGGRPRPDKAGYRAFLRAYERIAAGPEGLGLTYRAAFFRGSRG